MYQLSDFHYDLPKELIAQYPSEKRDHSRLMVVNCKDQTLSEMPFREILTLLDSNDRLIFNNTKVIPARLFGHKETGAKVEVLLVRRRENGFYEAMAKPGKRLKENDQIIFGDDLAAVVENTLDDGKKLLSFSYEGDFETVLQKYGSMPLPQYIQRAPGQEDHSRYQTVYASKPGAIAAPTAGLHFTDELLEAAGKKGVDMRYVTLHVGLGTFMPVKVDDIRDHQMHKEFYQINEALPPVSGKEIVVGTTTCRALESAANESGEVLPGTAETDIFIYPGYRFKRVKSLLTNFHLPGSTLLMLVSALGGKELILEAYRKAVKDRYRFFSYGDAMLILNESIGG